MEKIWLQSYPLGIPAEIDPGEDQSLVHLMEKSCRNYADRTAYISMGQRLSYRDLDQRAREFAGWLQSVGLGAGSRVALMMPNLLQYPICLFGALRAGCVVVNVNPLYTPRELQHQLQDSGAEAIVVVENFAHTVEQVLSATSLRHVVVTPVGELLGAVKGTLINFVLRRIRKQVPAWHIPAALDLKSAMIAGQRRGFTSTEVRPEDLAFLQYTGGTTGVSKGAMLSHRNVAANVNQARTWTSPAIGEEGEMIVSALPLYHIFALTASLIFVKAGAANLLIANPRDIKGFIKELRRHPFTALTGVNTLFNALLNDPAFAGLDFSRLAATLGSGAAVQQAVADRWQQVTGKVLTQAYGLTETSPAATINRFDAARFSGSIGLPLPSTELSIRDEDGRELPVGEVGEICIRGPQVTRGYWNRPDETALIFHADGFLRTGDLGYVDGRGYAYLVDRKKDMILVSGFNVYPNEIEDVVAAHPGVHEVAAIGVPSARSGEAVKIFVVRKDANLDADDLIAHCRDQLTSYKVPHIVEFRDELPKSNVGKVLRRALRDTPA
jgi:long-chain acyl-CoA synthetase